MRPVRLLSLLLALSGAGLAQPAPGRVSDIPAPAGCGRVPLPPGSYAAWLRDVPLKPDNSILAHGGDTIFPGFYRVLGVLGLPLMFRGDLEQCADWCFRLWAEYHLESGKLNQLYLFDYGGHRRRFSSSGRKYRGFVRWAMANANSHSLKQGCSAIEDTVDLMPGDMLVQNRGGGIGHVSVVMDACRDSSGNRFYLFGYGFMPAQEFHLEMADPKLGRDGWFSLEGYLEYLNRHFDFGRPAFRRFK